MMVLSLVKRTVYYAQCSFYSLPEVSCQVAFYKLRLSQSKLEQRRRKHRHTGIKALARSQDPTVSLAVLDAEPSVLVSG